MTTKKVKIVFEPGCFDNLDVSQEELDGIVEMLSSMTEEEILDNSRVLTDEDIEAMDDDEIEMLARALNREPRNLQ